ncbi:twin-arginine translocase subunit TatC [bacterium]|nr:twin-arginine translocase subunit TatC [bacterium]
MKAQDEENSTEEREESEMDFWGHIGELRKRIIIAACAVALCAVAGWYTSQQVFHLLAEPFQQMFGEAVLIGTGPAEAFILRLKVAVFTGALLASPVLFLQVWLFIAPGLLEEERKLAFPFVLGTTLLFLTGASFCYFIVMPFALEFFHQQYAALGGITPTIRVSEYLSLLIKAVLGFGLVFETPIFAFFAGRLGLITDQTLLSSGRYAIIAIFLISAILTPPDILTQFLMAGPLLLLYGMSIFIVRWTQPKEEGPTEEETTGGERR